MNDPTPPPKSRESYNAQGGEEDMDVSHQACEVPLQELLRAVPRKHRLELKIETGLGGYHLIPVGVHCHDAAARIDNLLQTIKESQRMLEMRTQDRNSLWKELMGAKEELRTLRAQNEGLMKLLQESADQLDGLNDGEDAPGMTSYEMDLEKRINAALKAATPAKELSLEDKEWIDKAWKSYSTGNPSIEELKPSPASQERKEGV